MGSTGAQGFAEAVEEGQISLRDALRWHLTANHYPPLHPVLIDTAIKAIELGNQEDWEAEIDLPEGVTCDGHTSLNVTEIIEDFHLDSFLQYNE